MMKTTSYHVQINHFIVIVIYRMGPLSSKLVYKPHEYHSYLVRYIYHKP